MITFWLIRLFLKQPKHNLVYTDVEVILSLSMELFKLLSEKLLSPCSISKKSYWKFYEYIFFLKNSSGLKFISKGKIPSDFPCTAISSVGKLCGIRYRKWNYSEINTRYALNKYNSRNYRAINLPLIPP